MQSTSRTTSLFVKDESCNPTLSFKDRKSTVAVTKALEHGFTTVACATAGNAGSSIAAYAARAGLSAYVFVFKGISESKLAKLLSYGARAFETFGSTRSVVDFAQEVCKRYGLAHVSAQSRYDPYTKEGAKTAIFEIFEQMGGVLPDWIIVPVGTGGNLAGYFKGMKELREIGLIENHSKLVGVQGDHCAPVVEAFDKGLDPEEIPTVPNPSSIAHSILDDWPPDGNQALAAIRETGGLAMGVSDDEIIRAMKMLSSKEGMYVEPASAAPLAALVKLFEQKAIEQDEKVVMIATGSGLNQPDAALTAWERPSQIEMNVSDFERFVSGL